MGEYACGRCVNTGCPRSLEALLFLSCDRAMAPINPRRHRPFRILSRHKRGGGGGGYDPLAASLLIELELHGKTERVARRETMRLIYKLKVLGQPVTSEVRSSAEK